MNDATAAPNVSVTAVKTNDKKNKNAKLIPLFVGIGIAVAVIFGVAIGLGSKSYSNNKNYYVEIKGTKYEMGTEMSEFVKSGFTYWSDKLADEKIKANAYTTLIMGGYLEDEETGAHINFTPINKNDEKTAIKDAWIGRVEVNRNSDEEKNKLLSSIKTYGDISLESSKEDVIAVFGESDKSSENDLIYEERTDDGTVFKKFEFEFDEDGKMDSFTVLNYSSILRYE